MKRSAISLVIALFIHLALLILFLFLGSQSPQEKPPKKEQRIKVSLMEQPKAKRDAPIKNQIKPRQKTPPMPKGKQLKKLVKKPLKKVPPAPYTPPKPVVKVPPPKPKIPKTKPLPEAKSHITVPQSPSDKLYAKLLRPTVSTQQESKDQKSSKKRQSRISQDIKEAYGERFALLSEGEQKYILDHQEIMRRITQETLNRVASVSIPRSLRIDSFNLIEFYLYPNGDISDVKLLRRSGFYTLDDTTLETIEYAYSRYPRPKQKTLIRFKFAYYLRGY